MEEKTMKRYITTTILTLFLALTTVNAQNGLPAMTIHMKDGTKVTKLLKETPAMNFYGMNDEQDDDYVVCEAEASTVNVGEMTVACQLTPTAYDKKVNGECYIIISDKPINKEMLYTYNTQMNGSYRSTTISFKNHSAKGTLINLNKIVVNDVTFDDPSKFAYTITGLQEGTKYYVCAVLKSNNCCTTKDITMPYFPKGTLVASGKYVSLDGVTNFVNANKDLFGMNTNVARQLAEKYWMNILRNGDIDVELALADSVADNIYGKDYFFYSLTHKDEILERIKADEVNNMYIKATPQALAPSTTSTYEFGTNGIMQPLEEGAIMVQCDSKWEIPGNEYMLLQPSNTSAKPNPAFCLNGIMLPGKTYNVTITLAPQTDETDTENKPYYFNVYMVEGNGDYMNNDTYPRLATKAVNPTDPAGKSTEFIAEADKLTSFTIPFTPTKLVYCHGIQLAHIKSFTTSANRTKYCQAPRIVGFSVTAAE